MWVFNCSDKVKLCRHILQEYLGNFCLIENAGTSYTSIWEIFTWWRKCGQCHKVTLTKTWHGWIWTSLLWGHQSLPGIVTCTVLSSSHSPRNFVRTFPTTTINIKIYVRINHYLTVGAYVHCVHSEGQNQIKSFKRCKLQTVLMEKETKRSISKATNFNQCWCELKTCSSEFSKRHQVWRSCRPRPGLL